MDAMVSARISVEKRDRANGLLKRIGATPTQLINTAYDYLLETGHLPTLRKEPGLRPRVLSQDALQALRQSVEDTTFQVPAEYFEGKTDDQLLEEALVEKYLSLDGGVGAGDAALSGAVRTAGDAGAQRPRSGDGACGGAA